MDLIDVWRGALKVVNANLLRLFLTRYDKFHTVILIFTLNIPNREQRN